MSLIKLDVRTTTDQVLYLDPSSQRIFATPLGADPNSQESLLPVDANSILAAGVAGPVASVSSSPLQAPKSKKKKKKKAVQRLRESPFMQPSNGRSLRVAIYN